MPSAEPWKPLDRFDDPAVPKLHNLRRAARRGFSVPETWWAPASALGSNPPGSLPDHLPDAPCIVRSGSPTEDTRATSNAGQLLSLVVVCPGDFAGAVARVVGALPEVDGRPAGVAFVQPLIRAETAGVTFFDGFYYEETFAEGSNAGLTSGRERGEVRRGHVMRGDRHHAWLGRLRAMVGGPVDVEWAVPHAWATPDEPILLQVRPALFAIRRNPTISLANHKEILGDPPSPWMVGLLAEVARPVMGFFEAVDPEVATWDEPYAIEVGERAWMNFSAFFRLMDHWGLPRTMVTEGVGGESAGPLDAKADLGKIVRHLPTLARKGLRDVRGMLAIRRGLRTLDDDLDAAGTLAEIWAVNAEALAFSIRTNFAIMSVLSVVVRLRRALGVRGLGRVVTHEMMARYAELAARPEAADRRAGLDAWLAEFGHRGPLESDPARPRFLELREALRAGLDRGPAPAPEPRPRRSRPAALLGRVAFGPDEVREWFRDRLMWWWMKLRGRILEGARLAAGRGDLERWEDVFMLRGDDLGADPATWRAQVAARRSAWERARLVDPPDTGPLDEIEAAIGPAGFIDPGMNGCFRGIGLGSRAASGTAVLASELEPLLDGRDLPESPVLVAPTLEPSWAVVFPRFAAVVVDLGGELSHASILLREAGIPAVVNARGAYRSIRDGDRVTVDPARGEARVESRGMAQNEIENMP